MTLWTQMMDLPHKLEQVEVNGLWTRALTCGEGDPVLFLHGVSGHLEAYVPVLAAHAAEFEVHAIDMLGHGFTDKPDGPYTIDRFAEHVIGYLDRAGIERVHLCGLSLGAWVTAYVAGAHPDRVHRVSLAAAAGHPGMHDPKIAEMVRSTTADAILSDDPSFTRARLEGLLHDPARATAEMVDIRYQIYHQPELRARVDNLLALTESDQYERWMLTPERLARIEAEVLLIWSEEDAVSQMVGASHYVENIERNKLVVFPECGHWAAWECPELFSAYNVAFLRGGLDAVPASPVAVPVAA